MKKQQGEASEVLELAVLVAEYVHHALAHGQSLSAGDSRKTNKSHSEITRIHRRLRALGDAARRELLGLLEHPDLAVRSWAATHALEFAPERAALVLEAIAKEGPVPLCLSAEFALERWREGTLRWE